MSGTGLPSVIDAHVHVATTDTARFPLAPTGVGSDWWRHDGSVASLLTTLDANGVAKAVVVQAVGVYGYDCRYATAAAEAHPDRLALVGAVDLHGDDPAAELDALRVTAPVRGVRLFGVAGEPTWLTDGRADAVWQVADEHDLTIVPTIFADRLDDLARTVAQHPSVPVAVDHCAFVAPDDPPTTSALLALAALPSVNLKVTSYVLSAAAATDPNGDPAPFVDRLVEAFGARRLCWGSDHPQHQSLSYGAMLALADRAFRNVDADGRSHVFMATSDRLWWPAATPAA